MPTQKSTKNQILDVALQMFSENSYHGTSIRDIAKRIDKRESSIYNHFKSKDNILQELIVKFSERNFGPIILTDKLINNISKPEKFFLLLSENLLSFWNSNEERMFIKILLKNSKVEGVKTEYSLEKYLSDFKALCEFIFREMMKHKFIAKNDVTILSHEFISPLFLHQIESVLSDESIYSQKFKLKNHIDFFWNAVKK